MWGGKSSGTEVRSESLTTVQAACVCSLALSVGRPWLRAKVSAYSDSGRYALKTSVLQS